MIERAIRYSRTHQLSFVVHYQLNSMDRCQKAGNIIKLTVYQINVFDN